MDILREMTILNICMSILLKEEFPLYPDLFSRYDLSLHGDELRVRLLKEYGREADMENLYYMWVHLGGVFGFNRDTTCCWFERLGFVIMCNGTMGFNLTKHDSRGRLVINVEFGLDGGLYLKLLPGYRGYEKLRDAHILKARIYTICNKTMLNVIIP